MSAILVLGDSHTRAISDAVTQRVARGFDANHFEVSWLLTQKGETSRGSLPLEDALHRIGTLTPQDSIVAISLAGTLHNIFGLLKHERPWDFLLDRDNDEPAAGVMLIPHHTIRDAIRSTAINNKRISKIAGATRCRALHLSTPPPKADNDYINARAVRYRDRLVADTGINDPAVRLKLWLLEMRVLEELCAEWRIGFLPPPPGTQTVEGFLRPEYYAQDATHANAAYGEMVLQQLEEQSKQPL